MHGVGQASHLVWAATTPRVQTVPHDPPSLEFRPGWSGIVRPTDARRPPPTRRPIHDPSKHRAARARRRPLPRRARLQQQRRRRPATAPPRPRRPRAPPTEGSDPPATLPTRPTVEDGKLTVATGEPAFEPWVVDDDPTNGEGYESAVVYAVADQLGFDEDDVTWTRTGFDEAVAPGDKDYDFNVQQYSITAEREKVVDFSDGYYDGRAGARRRRRRPARRRHVARGPEGRQARRRPRHDEPRLHRELHRAVDAAAGLRRQRRGQGGLRRRPGRRDRVRPAHRLLHHRGRDPRLPPSSACCPRRASPSSSASSSSRTAALTGCVNDGAGHPARGRHARRARGGVAEPGRRHPDAGRSDAAVSEADPGGPADEPARASRILRGPGRSPAPGPGGGRAGRADRRGQHPRVRRRRGVAGRRAARTGRKVRDQFFNAEEFRRVVARRAPRVLGRRQMFVYAIGRHPRRGAPAGGRPQLPRPGVLPDPGAGHRLHRRDARHPADPADPPARLRRAGPRPAGCAVERDVLGRGRADAVVLGLHRRDLPLRHRRRCAESQRSSARAIGLTQWQTLRYAILPQAVRNVVPALMNTVVSLQKDVALVSVLGVREAVREAQILTVRTFNYTVLRGRHGAVPAVLHPARPPGRHLHRPGPRPSQQGGGVSPGADAPRAKLRVDGLTKRYGDRLVLDRHRARRRRARGGVPDRLERLGQVHAAALHRPARPDRRRSDPARRRRHHRPPARTPTRCAAASASCSSRSTCSRTCGSSTT